MSYLEDPVFKCVEGIRAPGALAEHLASAWTEWTGEVPDDVAVEADETAYEPFEGAVVMAEASVVPRDAQGEAIRLGLFLRVYPDSGGLGRAVDEARSESFVPSSGPPFFTIPSCHTAAWTLPNGPGTAGLPWVLDPGSIAGLSGGVSGDFAGGREGPWPRLVRCRPPERAEVEYCASRDTRLVLKMLARDDSDRARKNYKLIEEARASGAFGFQVPEVLVADLERSALVLREPAGRSFTTYLREPFREPFEKVGAALASLHRASIGPKAVSRPEVLMDAAIKAAQRIVRALPELESVTCRVVEGLLAGRPKSGPEFAVPVHGRLDADCIVLDGKSVGISGWDRLTTGHPYQDVAALLAHMIEESAACRTAASVARACIRGLTEAYSDAAEEPVRRPELSWHIAAALLLRAGGISLRRLPAGWHEALTGLLVEADALLSGDGRFLRKW